jgi:DnaJ-class molecular chaperone
LLGCKVEVPTIHGPKSLKLDPCVAFNAKLRLNGLGAKHDKGHGNHIVAFKIKPTTLSEEQIIKISEAFPLSKAAPELQKSENT